jgi:hypothetical protein
MVILRSIDSSPGEGNAVDPNGSIHVSLKFVSARLTIMFAIMLLWLRAARIGSLKWRGLLLRTLRLFFIDERRPLRRELAHRPRGTSISTVARYSSPMTQRPDRHCRIVRP